MFRSRAANLLVTGAIIAGGAASVAYSIVRPEQGVQADRLEFSVIDLPFVTIYSTICNGNWDGMSLPRYFDGPSQGFHMFKEPLSREGAYLAAREFLKEHGYDPNFVEIDFYPCIPYRRKVLTI